MNVKDKIETDFQEINQDKSEDLIDCLVEEGFSIEQFFSN